MRAYFIVAVISTLLEEAAIVIIVLWALPAVGIRIPLAGMIALMLAWGAWSIFTYRLGSRALKKQAVNLTNMIGSKGKVVSPLAPEGLVRIKGELWVAKSASGEMKTDGEVTVVGQDGLKLVVRATSAANNLEKTE